ncbi:uncharacterized protein G2W53_012027 [Senna tora]|uniref:Uncharacterized protein n=1 Tax=Senna tora TaxID=362788 RepID=A0A834U3I3_9FABA|nr:uncharacterized protein G2W53_012027 [Senna tora]
MADKPWGDLECELGHYIVQGKNKTIGSPVTGTNDNVSQTS